jgi:predicted PurR-regulated permease PerM
VTERIKKGGMEILVSMLAATPLVIAQLLTGLVLILFLLIFGPSLFQAYVDGLQKDHDKRQVLVLVGNIQRVLSRYISTISLINLGLGVCTALSLKLLGVEDALLWRVLAAVRVLLTVPLTVPLLVCIKLIIGQLGIWQQLITMLEAEG